MQMQHPCLMVGMEEMWPSAEDYHKDIYSPYMQDIVKMGDRDQVKMILQGNIWLVHT